MMLSKLNSIYACFKNDDSIISYKQLASGHINDTFLIETKKNAFFILQQINKGVFKNVPGLINNKVLISSHLQNKNTHLTDDELKRRVLCFVKTLKGYNYHTDNAGNYWNMMIYIKDSVTYDTVKCLDVAYEGGKLMGDFLNLTSDFNTNSLIEVIPKFHSMSFRFNQYNKALCIASKERLAKASAYLGLVEELKDEMHIIEELKASGDIKIRVTHNDTKISNILFDCNKKGLCVIDTDTVMPGIVHYDFGDAIRTICNEAAEDEKDLNKVKFNINYYKAYVNGFLEKMKPELTSLEIKYLPLGAKTMVFIMGLRFLTDYLNNDIYYKTSYSEHNLDRSKNQFKLLESLSSQYKEMDILNSLS
ncbi:phosphotransferase enzyme family protein [Cellulophaga lytica]|uniref:phosphotransferase enzyme family protein n=1 Tax=Cellulophaga lytica TaxID=979 RepID=UPI00095058C6|nr:phosphotransferase [Cellulophaga lytica]APU11167.1 phosphotransferase [Cellulophaga lytica]MDO6854726.1 phosphotransferase [Cellulophaga lytica]